MNNEKSEVVNKVPPDETIAAYLEKYGFKKSVAGDETFARAVKLLNQTLLTGLGVFISGKCGVGKSLLTRIIAQAVTRDGGFFPISNRKSQIPNVSSVMIKYMAIDGKGCYLLSKQE